MKKFLKLMLFFSLVLAAVYAARGDFSVFLKKLYPFDYKLEISAAAAENNLDPYLVAALIKAESGFNENAHSHIAHGLMQLTDDTARFVSEKTGLDYDKRLEPRTNIRMGCWYLAYLIDKFGDIHTALCAYNAGPATVTRWLSDSEISAGGKKLDKIPFGETDGSVDKIRRYYKTYKKLYGGKSELEF